MGINLMRMITKSDTASIEHYSDRIARYGNLVIYERGGVLIAEWDRI